MIVGIPRGLFYYKYHVLWQTFWDHLGVETSLSPPTNRGILDAGIRACVGEACLPVKNYFGHVLDVKDKADVLFIPRYISVHKHEFICPKFGGLPDMVRHGLAGLPPILDIDVNHHQGNPRASLQAAVEAGRQLGYAKKACAQAWEQALQAYQRHRYGQVGSILPALRQENKSTPPRILVLGHVYNVYDPFLNMHLLDRLQALGAEVMTAESTDGRIIRNACGIMEEPLFWTLGVQVLGSAYQALEDPTVTGVLYITSFGCGLDAFVENMVARRMHRHGKPYLVLTIDEHSGEEGIKTRLEAFMDTLMLRRNDEAHISAHG